MSETATTKATKVTKSTETEVPTEAAARKQAASNGAATEANADRLLRELATLEKKLAVKDAEVMDATKAVKQAREELEKMSKDLTDALNKNNSKIKLDAYQITKSDLWIGGCAAAAVGVAAMATTYVVARRAGRVEGINFAIKSSLDAKLVPDTNGEPRLLIAMSDPNKQKML